MYNEFMESRGLIASWLLVTVLLAPVLGLAVCVSFPAATAHCMPGCRYCGMQNPRMDAHASAPHSSAPIAPCCQRKAPTPAMGESSAQIVAPVQFALMPAAAPVAMLPAIAAIRIEKLAAPPPLNPPLLLLCTLLI